MAAVKPLSAHEFLGGDHGAIGIGRGAVHLRNPLRRKENDGAMAGRSLLEPPDARSSLPRADRGREGRGQDRLRGGVRQAEPDHPE